MHIAFLIISFLMFSFLLGHILGTGAARMSGESRRLLPLPVTIGILLASLVACSRVFACDCSLPQNYGNKQCVATITAALNAKPISTSNSTSNSTSAAKANSASNSSSVSGAGASATVGAITNASTATGGQSNAQGGSATAQGGNQRQQQSQSANNAQTLELSGGNTTYEAARIPVATAFAAALTSAQCGVGSTSGGVQTPLVGVSFGTTRQNKEMRKHCNDLDTLRVAFVISPVVGCHEALLVMPDIRAAMEAAQVTCEQVYAPEPVPVNTPQPTGYTQEEVDAIVKKALRK